MHCDNCGAWPSLTAIAARAQALIAEQMRCIEGEMMRINHIQIDNFRGIRHMEWSVRGSVVCLIGPGDSTKSTILDAIEYALSPHWNVSF